jgi:transcriptional regulator with XRE-family HTH domain
VDYHIIEFPIKILKNNIPYICCINMGDKAYITPNVLRWARESARMSEETAAAKVSVTLDKLKEWELGTSQPTIRQAQNLAKAYKRPFALFFLPDIPRDFHPHRISEKKAQKS